MGREMWATSTTENIILQDDRILFNMYILTITFFLFIFRLQPQSKSTKIIKFVIELSVFSLLFWGLLKMPDELKPIVVTKWILSMF